MSVFESGANPLDIVEALGRAKEWELERSESEISTLVTGRYSDYTLNFTWMDDIQVLHVACGFDLKIPEARLAEVRMLIANINEQLWLGHFDIWQKEGMILFRHGMLLIDTEVDPGQCDAVVVTALDICERYFPAFQFVIWAGKSARDALEAVAFDTQGSA